MGLHQVSGMRQRAEMVKRESICTESRVEVVWEQAAQAEMRRWEWRWKGYMGRVRGAAGEAGYATILNVVSEWRVAMYKRAWVDRFGVHEMLSSCELGSAIWRRELRSRCTLPPHGAERWKSRATWQRGQLHRTLRSSRERPPNRGHVAPHCDSRWGSHLGRSPWSYARSNLCRLRRRSLTRTGWVR